MPAKPHKTDIAEIHIFGERLKGGQLFWPGSEDILKDWPEEIEVVGGVYTLEEVVVEEGNLEWGIYA